MFRLSLQVKSFGFRLCPCRLTKIRLTQFAPETIRFNCDSGVDTIKFDCSKAFKISARTVRFEEQKFLLNLKSEAVIFLFKHCLLSFAAR